MLAVLLFSMALVSAQPSLPPLPTDFSLIVEANFLQKNKTMHLVEYHSDTLGFTRMEFKRGPTTFIEIIDEKTKTRHEMVINGDDSPFNCTSSHIDSRSRFNRPRDFASMFRFGGEYEETYQGFATVRGIQAQHWTHRFVSAGSGDRSDFGGVAYDFVQDFFFSAPEWTVDGVKQGQVPLRSLVKGMFNGTAFENHYEIAKFTVGDLPSWYSNNLFGNCIVQRSMSLVAVPVTTSSFAPPLPTLPKDYSVVIEANVLAKNYTQHMTSFHSETLGKSRVDVSRNGKYYIEIFDFNSKERSEIVIESGQQELNCTTKKIEGTGFFSTQHSFQDLFQFGGKAYEETYRGKAVVRGILTDHWTHRFRGNSSERFGNVTFDFVQDFFFSEPDWKVDGQERVRVPIRSNVRGFHNGTFFENNYEFIEFTSFEDAPEWASDEIFADCSHQEKIVTAAGSGGRALHVTKVDHTLAIVLLFAGLVLGIVVGAGVACCIVSRRSVTRA